MLLSIATPNGLRTSFHTTGRVCASGDCPGNFAPPASTSAPPPRAKKARMRAAAPGGSESGDPARIKVVTVLAGCVESASEMSRTS